MYLACKERPEATFNHYKLNSESQDQTKNKNVYAFTGTSAITLTLCWIEFSDNSECRTKTDNTV